MEYLIDNTDWDISVICNEDPKIREWLPEQVRYIPVSMKRGVSLGGVGAMLKMAKIFRKEKFDMVQYSTPNAALYASIASKLAGIKIRKYHLMGFRYLGFSGVRQRLFKAIEKTACKLSTHIECVSQSNLKLGLNEGVFPEGKASILHYGSSLGVDLAQFDLSQKEQWRSQMRKEYGYKDGECVFGYMGRLNRDKGMNELFTAFSQLENVKAKLFIAGAEEPNSGLDYDLLRWAKSAENITFHGYVNDIQRYFAMLDVLILPSYREGFGNIVIEAQAMGVPVIVSDIPGPTDAMSPGETGLTIPAKDAQALRQAMEEMAAHPDMRVEMGTNGRQFVEERFDQKKLCEIILQDRRKLLGE
jgi:glycosyltransferase involved in cell wall biosynthesis